MSASDFINKSHLEQSKNNNSSPSEYDIMQQPWLKGIFIFFYIVIFILGLLGNSLLIYSVAHDKSKQSIINIFIANMASSDMMMVLVAVPFTPISAFFLKSWVFGDVLCRILPMILNVSVYVSTFTSTAIAIARYFGIVHPLKPQMNFFVCFLLIISIWVISVCISLPLAIYQKVSWSESEEVYVCYEYWPGKIARQFYTILNLILQYIVPCFILIFCYTKILFVLRIRAKTKIGTGLKTPEANELEIRRKQRTTKILIAMMVIFVCCWFPINFIHIMSEYNQDFVKWENLVLVFFIAHVIAMSSAVYNPFLYALMSENFRKEFKAVVPFLYPK